jgi:hypothetical protein
MPTTIHEPWRSGRNPANPIGQALCQRHTANGKQRLSLLCLLIRQESDDKGPLVKTDFEVLKDACPPQQVETYPKSVREAHGSYQPMFTHLDLEIVEIHGNEASIPHLDVCPSPRAVDQTKAIGDLRSEHTISCSTIYVGPDRMPSFPIPDGQGDNWDTQAL